MAWRQILASAAVLIVAVGAVTGAIALRGTQPGTSAPVEFHAGPTSDVRTLDAAGFAFEFPADWHAYDSSTNHPGLSSIAVIGTRPVEEACGDERHVDVTCVNERLLEAGEVRMNVATGTFFGGSFRDRPSITSGTTVRLEIGGQLAILDDVDADGDDYYGSTESLHLYIEQPDKPNEIVLIDLIARDGGSDEVMQVMQHVIDTFRFDGAITPQESPVDVTDPEPTPRPSPAWGPWPPRDAFSVVEFKDETGQKASVAVVDGSAMLEWVEEGVPDPAIGEPVTDGGGLIRDPSSAHRYRLRWTTTVCDREMTVTIAPEAARILIEHAPRGGCDTMAIGRDLVLQFTEDPAFVEVQVVPPPLLPESPSEPTTMVVDLERGDSTESVLVIDRAGALMEARPADPVPTIPDFVGVRIVRAEDGGTIVVWEGLLCDRDHWISIEADDLGPPDRIVVHGTRVEPCRMALIRRAIWLDLGPVGVESIDGRLSMSATSLGQIEPGPVVDITGALVVQSLPGDDRTLQVRGWYWRDPVIYDCFVPPSPPPALESGCQGPHDRLAADPKDLTGPGFVVWLRPGVETWPIRYGGPSEVVVAGHFDDALAGACAPSTRDSCRDVFIVEEIVPASAP